MSLCTNDIIYVSIDSLLIMDYRFLLLCKSEDFLICEFHITGYWYFCIPPKCCIFILECI